MKTKNKQEGVYNSEFIKTVARAFAFDLLRYSENGGDMENITAAKVYEFLETLDKQAE